MITLIAAMDEKRGIGKDGKMPWHIAGDLAYFKSVTLDHTIVMGRKTYDSLGRPTGLPGRHNIVVTRNREVAIPHPVSVVNDLDIALATSYREEIFVIGGAELYTQTLPIADKLILTTVSGDHNCDTFFPEVDWPYWQWTGVIGRIGYTINTYQRIRNARF